VPPLSDDEIVPLKMQVPAWQVVTMDGVKRLKRELTFRDFRAAMAFAVHAGMIAEREDHHPDLHVGWGRVVIEIWTHKIRGLHENDFILAAKIDTIPLTPAPAST
jgi:4a-hydroxytetrahydrobiopterin dehydratase